MNFRRFCLSTTAFVLIAGSLVAQAQTPALRGDAGTTLALDTPALGAVGSPSAGSAAAGAPASGTLAAAESILGSGSSPAPAGPPQPEFLLNASVNFSESYVTNAAGESGSSRADFLSSPGFHVDLHEHSRRVTIDANYDFLASLYAKNTLPTQFYNNLQALGDLDVVPEYLDVDMRAFAQPAVTSGFGAIAAGNREIPGTFTNSYGYFATPDLKFALGDFASSKTMPSYGQVFFTNPPGTTPANTILGLGGPEDTTLRSLTEELSSGTDFTRLGWKLVGLFSETARLDNLLTEKSGVATGRYALNDEWSLIATGGYDSVKDTTPLIHDVSGPEALAGIGLTLGKDFNFQVEAGERYNSLSFDGNLRWEIGPTGAITALANDYVQTPEGQLLNNLTDLTALPNGTLTSANNILGNGTALPMVPFSVQSPDNPSLDQFVSRYQTVMVALAEEFSRTDVSLSVFGTRRTYLVPGFVGPPTAESWGTQLSASRNLNPLLMATLGAGYIHDQEFGGQASTITLNGQLQYMLSRQTQIFVRTDYLTRISSSSFLAFTPLAGNVSDFRATLGISHTL